MSSTVEKSLRAHDREGFGHKGGLAGLASTMPRADFLCVHVETANGTRSSLCSVGVVAVAEGREVAKASELVDPQCGFNPFNTLVNGIDKASVAGARSLTEVWGDLVAICTDRVVVFQNATNDVPILRASAALYSLHGLNIAFACSTQFARRLWPDLASYGLPALARELGIEFDRHDPGSAASAFAEVVLRQLAECNAVDVDDLNSRLRMTPGRLGVESFIPIKVSGSAVSGQRATDAGGDSCNPMSGLTICFTGRLLSMFRKDAAELVIAAGGTFVVSMSGKVDLLVAGDFDYLDFADGYPTAKLAKAAKLCADGRGPEIVREADFMRMLAG